MNREKVIQDMHKFTGTDMSYLREYSDIDKVVNLDITLLYNDSRMLGLYESYSINTESLKPQSLLVLILNEESVGDSSYHNACDIIKDYSDTYTESDIFNSFILVGTGNSQKAGYIKSILLEKGISEDHIITTDMLNDEVNYDFPETGKTYHENANIKADAWLNVIKESDRYSKSVKEVLDKIDFVITDDSGINIDSNPEILGVHTKREYDSAVKKGFEGSMGEYISFTCSRLQSSRTAKAIFHITFLNVRKELKTDFQGVWTGTVSDDVYIKNGKGFDSHFIPDNAKYNLKGGMYTRDIFNLEEVN